MIRRIDTCMQDDYTKMMQVLGAWRQVVHDLKWTHWLNFNPCIPRIDEFAVQRIGYDIACRIRDRLNLRQGRILLIPEVSNDGLWHYHGFATVPMVHQAKRLEANGERWALNKMRALVQHRYSDGFNHDIRPTAVIQARKGDPSDAESYALKNGYLQGKAGAIIWS